MKQFETNEWILLNEIIYKIYTTDDFDAMRKDFLEQMRMTVNFDSADFFLAAKNDENGLCDPVTYNCEGERSLQYDELDYSRGIMYSGKSIVYRETDIISDEKRIQTEYYKKVYQPNNWHYSLQIILSRNNKFMGVITLYRVIGKDNFEYDDIFILDMLKNHLSFRISKEMERKENNSNKLTIVQAVQKYELTKREEMILVLLMAGKDNDEICNVLVITSNTLKKHILNIYRKLGIKNRVQMFKLIKEKG